MMEGIDDEREESDERTSVRCSVTRRGPEMVEHILGQCMQRQYG